MKCVSSNGAGSNKARTRRRATSAIFGQVKPPCASNASRWADPRKKKGKANVYHPNKIDWLIYSFFRWWWNPIFSNNPKLAEGFVKLFQMHMKDNKGKVVHVPNPFWWH